MDIFKKIFKPSKKSFDEKDIVDLNINELNMPIDEKFVINFKQNGGKFIYCENITEAYNQFENILAENDWFESQALCFENQLVNFLEINKLSFSSVKNPKFLICSCESLIAYDGSILFCSNQIKHLKPNELPINIVVVASPTHIVNESTDGLSILKNKYQGNYPTNITSLKYFKKAVEENFTQYGSVPKNIYLLLIENNIHE